MLKNLFVLCILSFCGFINLLAQSEWIEWSEHLSETEDVEILRNKYELLTELSENPININSATKEQLEQIPFLSDELIESILLYVYKYGPLVSLNELMGIEGMDYQTRRFLQEFIYIGKSDEGKKLNLKNIIKYNKQELLTRVDIPLNEKAGYKNYDKEVLEKNPNKKYYGDPFYHNLRYRFRYNNQLFAGFTAEKDSGEPFFKSYNRKGYDFYSAYFFLKDVGRLKTLALGDYRVNFGYGLVINTAFGFGKISLPDNVSRAGQGISKYTSTNESYYLRGMAATYRLFPRLNVSLWYSFKKEDALVNNKLISSFKTDGYHRLKKDLEKKNTVTNHLVGSNLSYNGKYFEGGLTAVYNVFDKTLNPEIKPYNIYYPRGKSFYNVGAYYKLFFRKLIIAGELAVDKRGKFALLNTITYSPTVNTNLVLINRYYDKAYQSLYSNAFSENSKLQNEAGVYIGLQSNLLSRLKLLCYTDFFYFPYRRYQVDAFKTTGMEGAFQLSYSPSNPWNLLIKYTLKNKAKNYVSGEKKFVLPEIRQRVRFQLIYTHNEHIQLKSVAEYVRNERWKQTSANGFALGNTVKLGWKNFPVRVIVSNVCFRTEDYGSRIYMYEPGLLYAFSMNSFYGKGVRSALNLRYEWKHRLVLQAKGGWTCYADRDHISSGTEEIKGNNKYDLQFQLKLKW